jgi:hypothetical protein
MHVQITVFASVFACVTSTSGIWSWGCYGRDNGPLSECLNQQVKPPNPLKGSLQVTFWRDLEVADGKFDWSNFDLKLNKSAHAGLQVQPIMYIYDAAKNMPDWLAKISKPIQYHRQTKTGPLEEAPNFLDPTFQNRWNRMVKALANHLAGLPKDVKKQVWASQVVAGITGDNRPWQGPTANPSDEISASDWMAYTRKVADMYIDAFKGSGIPVVANLESGFSGQNDQAWFVQRAYSKGMRGASVKEGIPSHFYNLNDEIQTYNSEKSLINTKQPDGTFVHARGEMCTNPEPQLGQYGNWKQSPWWSLQANAEWALTFGLDVWNVYSGELSPTRSTCTYCRYP